MKDWTKTRCLLIVSSFPGSWWTSSFAYPITLLRYSNFLRLSDTQGHWSGTLSDLYSGFNGCMGLALIFTGVCFPQDYYFRVPTWLLLTQDGRGKAGRSPWTDRMGRRLLWLHWGAKLCHLCPGLFHWARHLQAFGVLDMQTPSQSLVSGQNFLSVALIIQPELWGLFPVPLPAPLPKVLKDKTLVSSSLISKQ